MMEKVLNNSKLIFSKIYFALEFVISLILIKSIFEFVNIRIYNGYYSLNKIIIIFVFMIAFIGIIVYFFKKPNKSLEFIFLFVAIPLGIGYGIFIMPQNVPDEGSHIMRAYDISMGHFITKIDEKGNSSSTIIEELRNYSYLRFENYNELIFETNETTDYNDTSEIICAAQGNSPLLYIGASCAFLIGRLTGMNIFIAVYLGRLFNLIIYLTIGYFAIKKIPFGKLLLLLLLCMPMMLQQAAAISSDSFLNSTLVYFISYLIYLIFKEKEITKKDRIVLYILTALVGMFKYIYILVAGILLIKIFRDKENLKKNLKMILLMILIGGFFCIGWYIIASQAKSVPQAFEEYNKEAHVSSIEQLSYIKGHVGKFAKVLVNEYYTYGFEYLSEAIGSKLGWLNINISSTIIVAYLILLIFACISEDSKYCFRKMEKIWINMITFIISLILFVLMYITFSPVGDHRISGIQGRYFSVIIVLPLLCLINKDNYFKIENRNKIIILSSFLINLLTLVEVFMFYV